MGMKSYFDYAENDFEFLKLNYKDGRIYNAMAAQAQSICEKYFKHIIAEYYAPRTEIEEYGKQSVLRTHSLTRLANFIGEDMGIGIDNEKIDKALMANGYYFSARYPGDDSITVTRRDMRVAMEAAEAARDFTLSAIQELEKKRQKQDTVDLGLVGIDSTDIDFGQ